MTRAEYLKKDIKVSVHSFQIFDLRVRHTSSDCMSQFASENAEYLIMFDFKRLGARLRLLIGYY